MTRLTLFCALLFASVTVLADGGAPAASTATPPAAAAAPAPAPAAASAVAAAQPKPKPKLVCETTHPMDSHINQRVCMTPEEMEERKKHDQEALRRMQAGGPAGCQLSGGC